MIANPNCKIVHTTSLASCKFTHAHCEFTCACEVLFWMTGCISVLLLGFQVSKEEWPATGTCVSI